MPESVRVHSPVDITAARLTAEAFAPFGDVIANPRPDVQPSPAAFALLARTGTDAVPANQGSAIKYRHVSRPRNLYGGGDGGARPEMNMFSCGARQLDGAGGGRGGGGTFPCPFSSGTPSPLRHSSPWLLPAPATLLPPATATPSTTWSSWRPACRRPTPIATCRCRGRWREEEEADKTRGWQGAIRPRAARPRVAPRLRRLGPPGRHVRPRHLARAHGGAGAHRLCRLPVHQRRGHRGLPGG